MRTVLLLFLLTQPMSRYVHHVSSYKHLSLGRLYSGVPLQGQGLGNLHKLLLITMRFELELYLLLGGGQQTKNILSSVKPFSPISSLFQGAAT